MFPREWMIPLWRSTEFRLELEKGTLMLKICCTFTCRKRWMLLPSSLSCSWSLQQSLWLWWFKHVFFYSKVVIMQHDFILWLDFSVLLRGNWAIFFLLLTFVYCVLDVLWSFHLLTFPLWLFCSLVLCDIMSFQAACNQLLWNSGLVTFWSQAPYWNRESTETPLLPSVKYECFLVWLFVSNPSCASASPLVSLDLQRASFTVMAPC